MKQLLTLVLVLITSCSFAMFDDSAEYFRAGKEVLIATSTDAGNYKLQVNGNAYVNGTITGTSAWVTASDTGYLNSWVDFGSGETPVQFKKDVTGRVVMRGLAKSGDVNTPMFVMPANYRPSAAVRFSVMTNNTTGYLIIESNGYVTLVNGNNVSVSFDSVSFVTD